MSLRQEALNAFKIDLMSPETEKILGAKPVWGPVTIGYLEEVWHQIDGENLPPGRGYVLFDVALTFGVPVAKVWEGKSIDELEKLMRRKYKNNPLYGTHKHRFMNRVTRVIARARKMANAQH